KLVGVGDASQLIEHEVGGHNGFVIVRVFRDRSIEIVVCDYLIPVSYNPVPILFPLCLRKPEFTKQSCTDLVMSLSWNHSCPVSVLLPRAKNLRPLKSRRISQQIHRRDPERLLGVE